ASGLLGSDSVSSVSGRASGTSAGTYLDTLSGATGTGLGNYSITYVNGALTITPAPLTITGASSTSTYTAGAQTNTFTASGLLGSDGVASVSGRASGTNAGTYLDALSGATGTGLGNYTITYVNGALTITPAPLTMPQPAPNANDRAQIDIRRLTSVPDAVRLEVTPSFVFRLVLPLVPPREQPLSTLPQTHPGF
ncbi:MAG: MBG domain-containing protein, partial [Betaproteobacteria bacterium]